MADSSPLLNITRPVLAFPPPQSSDIPKTQPGYPPPVARPSASTQGARLTPQFRLLRTALERGRAQLGDTTTASDPELVAVFDLAGTVDGFLRAASGISGLEFFIDLEEEKVAPDDDFFDASGGERSNKLVPQSLYMVMTNAQAVTELVRLFELWQQDPSVKLQRGLAPLKQVFGLLRSVRRWGPEDRVRETGLLRQWEEDIEDAETRTCRVDIELWHRRDARARRAAEEEVTLIIQRLGGEVVSTHHCQEIAYHGLLASIPRSHIEQVVAQGPQAIELLTTDRVMFVSPFRPMTFSASEPDHKAALTFDRAIPSGPPRIALFDGVPMSNHAALANRLIIDDPDDHASKYALDQRHHGTAMASLIAHGDLSNPGVALSQPIYVRPIFVPHSDLIRTEIAPTDQLLVDLIHRAFRRVFERTGGGEAASPSVCVVCLALGDPARQFVRRLSPLARLLDWLADLYNIVIVVSAGNVDTRPKLDLEASTDPEMRDSQALQSLYQQNQHRRLLSPAEAVNVLTIGSVQDDESNVSLPDTVADVIPVGLPAGYSPVGFGYRRSVKPETLLPGGRQVFQTPIAGAGITELVALTPRTYGPGLGVAAPGLAGQTDAVGYSCGTSNSTALAARTLGQILEVLDVSTAEDGLFPFPDRHYHPVLAKTLLVHALGWHDDLPRLRDLLDFSGRQTRPELTRIFGYGPVRSERVMTAARTRVVLLGAGSIAAKQRNTFSFPLPSVLSASTEWRRLTITLGWLSPVNVYSQKYRIARLWFTPSKDVIGVKPTEADHNAVKKGTVQHQVFEGKQATGFASGSELSINVDCRADGELEEPVRYGLAASLEVGSAVRVDLHSEVRSRLRDKVRERARIAAP